MTRPWLTDGNIDFAIDYQNSIRAHFDNPVKETHKSKQALSHQKALHAATCEYTYLQSLMLTKPIPQRETHKNENSLPINKSSFKEPDQFSALIKEDIALSFGRAGRGAVTTIAEALQIVNALAHPYQAERIYYRGEHHYGYELKSRAQRIMEDETNKPLQNTNGITERELNELKRFQNVAIINTIERVGSMMKYQSSYQKK